MRRKAWVWGYMLLAPAVFATESSYTEQLKKELKAAESPSSDSSSGSGSESYTQSIRDQLEKKHGALPPAGSYTEKILQEELKNQSRGSEQAPSYTDSEKQKIPFAEEGGAIQAYREGRSELKGKVRGTVRHAFGVRYGDGGLIKRSYSAPRVQLRDYSDIYGNTYSPDISFHYEFQPFHSESYGNIGIFILGGIGYSSGQGQFAYPVSKPGGSGVVDAGSDTRFQFYTLPLTIGANYRFNLFHAVRPYVMIGPSLVGFIETRNDSSKGSRGFSKGFTVSGGVSFLLDFLSSDHFWSLYSTFGIKHSYLTVDYTRFVGLGSDVLLSSSGVYLGFLFEY